MNELLANPLVQSAAVPLLVAFFAALVLRPAGGVVAGLGFALGFAAGAYLINKGFRVTPLSSTNKMILIGGGAVVFGLLVEFVLRRHWLRPWLLGAAAMGAALWLVWPRLGRLEGVDLWLTTLVPMLYAAWLVASTDRLNERPVNLAIAALALAIGTAVSTVLGASALLGQLGGAIAAAVGAYVLLFLIRGQFSPGGGFTVPVSILIALVGISAIVFGRKLPWYVLVPLALIPLLARLPIPAHWGTFARSLLVTLYTAPAAAAAIALTWRVTGAPSF